MESHACMDSKYGCHPCSFPRGQNNGVKLEDKQLMASEMAKEVLWLLESQKLLEKLRQNKLSGIDPFGAIGRLYEYLGGGPNDLNVFFTFAHFKSRK